MTNKNVPALGAGRIVVGKRRCYRWSPRRRKIFLAVLTDTANVRWACEKADMSVAAAYALKNRDADFATQWREALEAGYGELELLLLRQSLEGVERTETVEIGEERTLKYVKTVRSFPLSVAMRLLLSHHDEVVAFRRTQTVQGGPSSAIQRARAYLDDLRTRLRDGERAQDGAGI